MRILFVHQNFPSQYMHIVRALVAQGGHQLVGLRMADPRKPLPQIKGVQVVGYWPRRGSTAQIHPWVADLESKVIRAEACAEAVEQLLAKGFRPDLICAHPGWGECLLLKDVLPDVPLLCYEEFFYRARGLDLDFDSELQGELSWRDCARNRLKRANPILNLMASDWGVSPTQFQRDTYPAPWRDRISVIHDGIDLARIAANAGVAELRLPDGTLLRPGEPTVTFVNRRLEPYRGCHTFLRAIPGIQQQQPQSQIVVVGHTSGVSYGSACPRGEWKDVFLNEIDGDYDPSRVHFTGPLPYESYLQLLRLSAVHVYLTYPFVLSWSLLEALGSGCAVVGSATAPVQEVIHDGVNGVLVDFFSHGDLAEAVCELLANPQLRHKLSESAVAMARPYGLDVCLPQQLALIQLVGSGRFAGLPRD